MEATIRPLERSDARRGFSSGSPLHDRYVREFAWQNQQRHHLAVTYVAVDDLTHGVLGYVTVSASEVMSDARGGVAPRSFGGSVPALRIGCLAVDRRAQGHGLGTALLTHALKVALAQAVLSGCAAVLVEATPGAEGYYERFGFTPIAAIEGASAVRPRPTPMLLPIAQAAAALTAPSRPRSG